MTAETPPQRSDVDADLGFGSVVARESRRRLLNHDGSFNVRREGLGFFRSLSAYHYFLTITWTRFLTLVAAVYIAANAFFAGIYVACGPDALTGFERQGTGERFVTAFFFSVHTLSTIGYGTIAPQNLAANIVVTIESVVGLINYATVAGFVFARFARPTAKIVFSRNAVIAPYRDGIALMFRIANERRSELVELEAKVLLSWRREGGTALEREFRALRLERERVVFFPLSWTIVHPIDEESPLRGMTAEEFAERDPEILILLNGFDETFSQVVHTRSSYRAEEVVWGARFRSVFVPAPGGDLRIDVRLLHDIERI